MESENEKKRVVKIPVSYTQRYKNKLGKTAAPCEVSERFLRFEPRSSLTPGGDFMTLDVLTHDVDGNEKKLCRLILDRQDILNAVNAVKIEVWSPKPNA